MTMPHPAIALVFFPKMPALSFSFLFSPPILSSGILTIESSPWSSALMVMPGMRSYFIFSWSTRSRFSPIPSSAASSAGASFCFSSAAAGFARRFLFSIRLLLGFLRRRVPAVRRYRPFPAGWRRVRRERSIPRRARRCGSVRIRAGAAAFLRHGRDTAARPAPQGSAADAVRAFSWSLYLALLWMALLLNSTLVLPAIFTMTISPSLKPSMTPYMPPAVMTLSPFL